MAMSLAAPLSHVRTMRALACRALSSSSPRGYHHPHRTSTRAAPTNLHFPLHYGDKHNNNNNNNNRGRKKGHLQQVLVASSPRLSSPPARRAARVLRVQGCGRALCRPARGQLNAFSVPIVKSVSYGAFLYGRAGCLTDQNGGFWPSCRRLFGPLCTIKRLLVPVLPY